MEGGGVMYERRIKVKKKKKKIEGQHVPIMPDLRSMGHERTDSSNKGN